MKNGVGAVILAAGKGTRMDSPKSKNKVTLLLGDKPMIIHTVEALKNIKVSPIAIVVGFAKESVKKLFNEDILFSEQKKRLGTAHALSSAIPLFEKDTENIIVLNGDDSAFYTDEILRMVLKEHIAKKNSITFLTLEVDNPHGLGRIIRNVKGEVVAIVEEKDASESEKKISEVNPALYVFRMDFLKRYIKKVPKSKITGEYYIVSLVEVAIKNKEKIEAVNAGKIPWRGVNTRDEFEKAEKLFTKLHLKK